MSRIDPIRRSDLMRKAVRPDADHAEEATEGQVVRLPVPVDRVSRILPREAQGDAASAYSAQLLGQDGQKRGLRAGAEAIDAAKSLYNRTEWSGARDRRAPAGGKATIRV